ncbi:DUF2690 domain-containing protein [Streptomyces sp. BBFR2]|uniref:DUF2690 domain-containing protein n=1 Tax=Streptomyces sp. BBFR2 TaxID=3372854 RepID=UPI0037DA1BA1
MSTHPIDPAERPGGGEPGDVPHAVDPPAAGSPGGGPAAARAPGAGPSGGPPAPDRPGDVRSAAGPHAVEPPVTEASTGAAPATGPPEAGSARPDGAAEGRPDGGTAASGGGAAAGGAPPPEAGGRIRALGRRLRAHARHTLVVAVAAAVAGALVPLAVEAVRKAFEEPPPKCPGAGCDGKSPAGQCSADAVTWEPRVGNPVRLHLRYSATCGAVWGRIVNGEPGDMVTIRVRGGSSRSAVIDFNHDKFTDMASVGRTFHVRLCAVPSTSTHRVGTWVPYCFEGTERSDWE